MSLRVVCTAATTAPIVPSPDKRTPRDPPRKKTLIGGLAFSSSRPNSREFAATSFLTSAWESDSVESRVICSGETSEHLNEDHHGGSHADIEPSKLKVTKISQPKPTPTPSNLVFGHTFTDHMLNVPWSAETGWGAPEIKPYAPLTLEPSATVFHYAQGLFEGLKAYRDANGKITLFRPDMNMRRMNSSAARISLPTFNSEALVELIKKLIRIDKHWIPDQEGYSLYIRPAMIGTEAALGIHPPKDALLFVICSPVGPYYPDGFKPVALYGTTEYTRAAPGGIGAYKLAANYAPGVMVQKEAAKKGYVQNLWLYGPDHHITEVGTMNAFVVFKHNNGVTEIVTPPLDGIILPGVTRDSVLALARGHASGESPIEGMPEGKLVVSERPVTMKEVVRAAESGNLLEFFGTGTAAVISPVDRIGYLGKDLHIPTGPDGKPPPPPEEGAPPPIAAPSALDSIVLSQLRATPGPGLPALIHDYERNEGHVLDPSLPYESRPAQERRVSFERADAEAALDTGVVMVAHAFQHQDRHKVAVCSGFVLNVPSSDEGADGEQGDIVVATCAHTLEEMRNSSLLSALLAQPTEFASADTVDASPEGPHSGSFVLTSAPELHTPTPTFHPVHAISSSLHRSDLMLLSVARNTISGTSATFPSLPVSPYPVHPGTAIRAHFVVDKEPDEAGWHPWQQAQPRKLARAARRLETQRTFGLSKKFARKYYARTLFEMDMGQKQPLRTVLAITRGE
ncbi:hypothetical protein EIP86_000824 [Pleurotus ostreatoroseus]|nr:hypothetical protein EIP86_000824 [Pleurotus ostreatoroseus]